MANGQVCGRKTAVVAVVCVFAAVATACAPPSGSQPARLSASTPLIADFTRYCLDTHVERAPAITAANSAGLEVQTLPPMRPAVPVVAWVHPIRDTAVVTSFAGEEKDANGVPHATLCQAVDAKDDGASLKILDEWLGPGHRLGSMGAVHEFQLREGRVWPINGDDPVASKASRATGNHYVLVALHHNTVTTLALRRWRPPAR